ncbi:MAG: YdiU family protein [Magnetococcales bacterium]|nr:YdiU family protein [Magnetococcales bacterium]
MATIGWSFDNSYARLPEVLFTRIAPVPVQNPRLLILNTPLATRLGLDFSQTDTKDLAQLFTGNRLPEGSTPLAQAYAGHQFGHFTLLGDGRAIVLGEQVAPDGKRFDVQFKGSGRTPYSRNGDGRATLGPMLREFIISEAMHALGVPTTRTLAVASTGEWVLREQPEPGAILTRVATSHLRVGTFEYLAAREAFAVMRQLVDYALDRHDFTRTDDLNPALALLTGVIERQVALVVAWLRVGFIHGVMNTDNVAISGETIDYGPCAFMDAYHPATVFSSIDHAGRYAFDNQPPIAQWNCARLAEVLQPLLHEDPAHAHDLAMTAVEHFTPLFQGHWLAMMRRKLGLIGEEQADIELFEALLTWMARVAADYTRTFHALAAATLPASEPLFVDPEFQAWHRRWRQRAHAIGDPEQRLAMMRQANPACIPRNHKVEQALQAAVTSGDLQPTRDLISALSRPYDDRPELAPYQLPPRLEERVQQTFCGT